MITIDDFAKENVKRVFGNRTTKESNLIADRTEELRWLMDECMDDDNALFIELGVYQGRTINICAVRKPNRTFHGFDSFEGLPEEWYFSPGRTYPKGKAEKKSFYLDKLPDVRDNVILHKGWFNETLPEFVKEIKDGQYISFLHMDADLYSSTYEGFEILNDYIVPGTLIKFDEFYSWQMTYPECHTESKYENWKEGEFKALNDWMENYGREVKPYSRDSHQSATVIVTK